MSTIVKNIHIFKDGAWHPIKKVFKDGAWRTMKGIFYQGVWYEIDPDTDPYLQTIPSETTWLIDKTASYYNFNIQSNIYWKVEIDSSCSWLTFEVIHQPGAPPITVIQGSNNRQITFGVTENNTGFNRYTTIILYPINEPSLTPIQITVGQSIGSDPSGAGGGGGGGGGAVELPKIVIN